MTPDDSAQIAEFVQHVIDVQRGLYAYILTLVPNLSDADDVLQEANVVLWEKRDEFTAGTNFSAWAYRIAHFQVLAFRKRLGRDRLRFDDDLGSQLATEVNEHGEDLDSWRRALEECMMQLDQRQRKLLNCRYTSGQSMQTIANDTGRSTRAVIQALYRIRMALMRCIKKTIMAEQQS